VSYAEKNLISGETITFHGRLHVIVLLKAVLLGLVLDMGAVGLIFAGASQRDATGYFVAAVVLLMVSGMVLAAAVVSRNAAEFVVTNKRVIVKLGIVHKRTSEIFLNKVETVGVDQTMCGRMLGFGTIAVRGTGGTTEEFHQLANPFEFRRQVQEQIGRMLGQAAKATQ
jgi:uncharacterized membrane protein YdbT with pleckstrin-like domain